MSWPNKNEIIPIPKSDAIILTASIDMSTVPESEWEKIKWKKKALSTEEYRESGRQLYRYDYSGEDIGQGACITYSFTDKDVDKYIKFYSSIEKFRMSGQYVVYYIEPDIDTDIRVSAVNMVKKPLFIMHGDVVKLKVEFNRPYDKIPTRVKNGVKWMVKVDDKEDRLIVDNVVVRGGEISFVVPDTWKGKDVVLMPYIQEHTEDVSIPLCIIHDPLDEIHKMQEGETLKGISKKCGVSVEELKRINLQLKNQKGETINILPEVHFALNPLIKTYKNPNTDKGHWVNLDSIVLVGTSFFTGFPSLPENSIITGGALNDVKKWETVVKIIRNGKSFFINEKERFLRDSFTCPNITNYVQGWVERELKEAIKNKLPQSSDSDNSNKKVEELLRDQVVRKMDEIRKWVNEETKKNPNEDQKKWLQKKLEQRVDEIREPLKQMVKESLKSVKEWINKESDSKINDDFFTPVHVIGSFIYTMRRHANPNKIIMAIYDSKTFSSGTDNRLPDSWVEIGKEYFPTKYQRYIWVIDLDSNN